MELDVKTASAIVLLVGFVGLLFVKMELAVYLTLPFVLLSRHMPYLFTVANGVIVVVLVVAVIRASIECRANYRFAYTIQSPFFALSIFLLSAYLFSLALSSPDYSSTDDLRAHYKFFVSLCFAILYGSFLIGFVTTEKRFRNLIAVMLIILMSNLVFAPFTYVLGATDLLAGFIRSGTVEVGADQNQAVRLSGLFFHWEEYSQYLAMCSLMLMLVLLKTKGILQVFLGTVFAVSVVELFLTNSRGSVIVFAVGCFFVMSIKLVAEKKKFRTLITAFLVGLSVLSALIMAEATGLLSLADRFALMDETVKTPFGEMPAARAGAWVPAIIHGLERPLAGSGPSLLPYTLYNEHSGYLVWPHNLYLLIFATVGLVGLFCYSLLFSLMLAALLKSLRRDLAPLTRAIVLGLVVAWAAFLIESVKFDGWLRQPSSWFYYIWILVALSYATANLKRGEKSPATD